MQVRYIYVDELYNKVHFREINVSSYFFLGMFIIEKAVVLSTHQCI